MIERISLKGVFLLKKNNDFERALYNSRKKKDKLRKMTIVIMLIFGLFTVFSSFAFMGNF